MLVGIGALWVPILVSTFVVFVASALVWTVLPHHRNDYRKVPDEDGLMAELKRQRVQPGMYAVPHHSTGEAEGRNAFKKKIRSGNPAILHVESPEARLAMLAALFKNLLYYFVLMVLVAYVAGATTPAGSDYLQVFQVVGSVTFLAFAGALAHYAIWFGQSWAVTAKNVLDALLYAVLVAGVFGWLWP